MNDQVSKIKEIIKKEMTDYKAKISALSLKKKAILSEFTSKLKEQKIAKTEESLKK